ncbi:MAG: hypothetical protein AAGI49_06350 [Bacteroidota bacterium]
MKKYTLSLFFIACTLLLSAQKDETLFSATGIRLTGAWGGPVLAGTLVDGNIVRQSGSIFALEFNKNLTVGWSSNSVDFPSTTSGRVDFSFNGPFLNYAPAAQKAVHPSFGMLASGGRFGLVTQNNNQKNDIWVAQPHAGVEFNVFRWMKVQILGGYRFAFFVGDEFDGVSDSDLSAPFAALNAKFGFSWGTR